MVIYIGADHRGFKLKEEIKKHLDGEGYEVADVNPVFMDGDDYPDAAKAVAEKVGLNLEQSRGIITCGSGAGADITANKFPHMRSVLGFLPDQVFDARHDDDVNILTLAANFIDIDSAKKMIKIFLETKFDTAEERYRRRIGKILEIERNIADSGPGY